MSIALFQVKVLHRKFAELNKSIHIICWMCLWHIYPFELVVVLMVAVVALVAAVALAVVFDSEIVVEFELEFAANFETIAGKYRQYQQ